MARYRTKYPSLEKMERKWWVVDAKGKPLGRLASQIAYMLRGKHKPYYTPYWDCGDFIVVINAKEVKLTGKKADSKVYYWHTGYFGGLKGRTFKEMLNKKPEEIIRLAVRGMLPKNALGRKMLKKLKIYAASNHPHQAQKPENLELKL
jgi:large subunit ribosomal protein L13